MSDEANRPSQPGSNQRGLWDSNPESEIASGPTRFRSLLPTPKEGAAESSTTAQARHLAEDQRKSQPPGAPPGLRFVPEDLRAKRTPSAPPPRRRSSPSQSPKSLPSPPPPSSGRAGFGKTGSTKNSGSLSRAATHSPSLESSVEQELADADLTTSELHSPLSDTTVVPSINPVGAEPTAGSSAIHSDAAHSGAVEAEAAIETSTARKTANRHQSTDPDKTDTNEANTNEANTDEANAAEQDLDAGSDREPRYVVGDSLNAQARSVPPASSAKPLDRRAIGAAAGAIGLLGLGWFMFSGDGSDGSTNPTEDPSENTATNATDNSSDGDKVAAQEPSLPVRAAGKQPTGSPQKQPADSTKEQTELAAAPAKHPELSSAIDKGPDATQSEAPGKAPKTAGLDTDSNPDLDSNLDLREPTNPDDGIASSGDGPPLVVRPAKKLKTCDELLPGGFRPQKKPKLFMAKDRWNKALDALNLGELNRAHGLMCESATWHQSGPATYGLAEFLMKGGDYTQALEWTARIPERDKGTRRLAKVLIGDIYALQGKQEEAKESWLSSLTPIPKGDKAIARAAAKYARAGKKALTHKDHWLTERIFRRAVVLDPNHADAAAGLAMALRRQSLVKPARQWIRHAVQLNPKSAFAQIELLEQQVIDNETEAARRTLSLAQELAPRSQRLKALAQRLN